MKEISNYIFALIIIALGCNSHNADKRTDISVEKNNKFKFPYNVKIPKPETDTLFISEISDSIKFIPLETNKKSFIKKIQKVKLYDSLIFIQDWKNLLVFNSEGKFIRQIGRKGKGPGEYSWILNFDIYKDTIYLSTSIKNTLIKYTIDGKFCEEINPRIDTEYFDISSSGIISFYNRYNGIVYFHNVKGKLIDSTVVERNVSFNRRIWSLGDSYFKNYMQKTSSGLILSNYVNDTIWSLSNNKKHPAFILDMKGKLLPWKYQIEYYPNDYEEWKKVSAPYHKVKLWHINQYIFIMQKGWWARELNTMYYHNIKTNVTHAFNTGYFYDDLKINEKILPSWNSSNTIICEMQAFKIYNKFKSLTQYAKYPSKKWVNRIKSVKENDNPVIVLIKPKNSLK